MPVDTPRLIALVAQRAEHTDAWTAAAEVLRKLPQDVVFELAKKLLVDGYFSVKQTCDDDLDIMTMPIKRSKPKASRCPRSKAAPSSGDAEFARRGREIDERFWASMKRSIDIFERELKAEWTADLLAGSFTGANGERVTWADATIEDHLAAVDDAGAHIALASAKAGSHTKAIRDMESAGVATLAELVSQVAA